MISQKAVRVERSRSIRAPQQRVYQLLSRVEGHPRFADLWMTADVLQHGGGQVVAEFRGYFAGLPVESVQRVQLRPPLRIEFRQLRGTLKALRGEYLFERDGTSTKLTARLEVEAGVPLLEEEIVRTVLTTALGRVVAKIKDAAERDLPRLVARRPAAVEAPGSAGAEGTNGVLPAADAPTDQAEAAPTEDVGEDAPGVSAVESPPQREKPEIRSAQSPGRRPGGPSGVGGEGVKRGRRRRRRHRRPRGAGPTGPTP